MIHLDDNIYVVAKMYDESLQIHIRQYTQFGNKLYSTKKGVVLNLPRCQMVIAGSELRHNSVQTELIFTEIIELK
jgi:hypothetical protein